jgi:hypothetical protein
MVILYGIFIENDSGLEGKSISPTGDDNKKDNDYCNCNGESKKAEAATRAASASMLG